ncbi:MAG: hypothetical protein RL246_1292 [Bacteroidota bacterium]|jgi:UPF0755 protein
MVSNKKFKIFILVFSLLAAMFSYYAWQIFKTPNFEVEKKPFALLIPKGSTYESVLDTLEKHKLIRDELSFRFLAKVFNYPARVKPGRYLIYETTGNWELIRKLRNGSQDALKITISNIRLKEDLAGKLGRQLAYDSATIYHLLDSSTIVEPLGFTKETIPCLFIPDTYEVYWTTTFDDFLVKMKKSYDRFWTEKRIQEAKALGLTPTEVGILASIVYGESKESSEQARIAGVYWNRLQVNMPLQADPTIVFAWKDFTIKRVTGRYTAINSPFNTYRLSGLPPGPISIPNPKVMDKVLQLEKHDYLYFCAKEDFSGFHNFAVSYPEHLQNAAKYQKALDEYQIK